MEIAIVRDPADPIAASAPVAWAVDRLRSLLEGRSIRVSLADRTASVAGNDATLVVVGADRPAPAQAIAASGVGGPDGPESFGLFPDTIDGAERLFVCGSDVRGLVYGVLELADRVEHGRPHDATFQPAALVERPANAVRSVMRLFCSEIEDKPWFHDEAFWERYLSMLAAQRFNRFSLTLGLGYNYHRGVTDAYLHFAYPFLVSVPGYGVRVPQLPAAERAQNLEMLRFISDQTVARGLDFQLGLWTHAFAWIDSPDAHHTIEGLTPETHAVYCRDAVRTLLEHCPAIGGLTLRIHGESGVPEGSWGFWKTVFEGVASCGRRVGIDLHAKGLDERTLGHALDTGLPITVSPKFWAEHMGLPYHQAAIRERERLVRDDPSHLSEWHRYMNVSEGSRPFTRYGYGDFLREERSYDVVFRLWPGTQRLLLWGDPAFAAGYGRAASLAGSQGIEWCEPLTFKGREGSGTLGSRTGYADPSLVPRDDWEKYAHTYRLFGRLTYEPDAPAETWRRPLRALFGRVALDAEFALASASRILPLVTIAHHPSASNNYYWPEMYTDMPMVWRQGRSQIHPYIDTPMPRRFGTVSPLDPEIFASVEGFVREVLSGERSGRYSPLEVAGWLRDLSEEAAGHLAKIEAEFGEDAEPDVRRLIVDVAILEALGRFFADKFRAAVLYEFSVRTGSGVLLRDALDAYRAARGAWASAADRASGVYVDDLTFGPESHLGGHWSDRLVSIDRDLDDLTAFARIPPPRNELPEAEVRRLLDQAERRSPAIAASHMPPRSFVRGEPIPLTLAIGQVGSAAVSAVQLRYRRMNHSETYAEVEMSREGTRFAATIPGSYSDSPYPLAYFFVLREATGSAWMWPGFDARLSGQPYFVLSTPDRGRSRRPGRMDRPGRSRRLIRPGGSGA